MTSGSTTRRRLIASAALAASDLSSLEALAQTPEKADFLFVQSAKGLTFDSATNKLTLTGISPVTVYFTDRPERIAGNMKTTSFIPFWSKGKDSFKSDPPNADISLLEGQTHSNCGRAAGSPAGRRRPCLHGQGASGSNAGEGCRYFRIHRRYRYAADPLLLCGCCATSVPSGILLPVK